MFRGQPIRTEGRYHILDNGSLTVDGVAGSDAANYTCTASNEVGESHISYMLRVQGIWSLTSLPPSLSLSLLFDVWSVAVFVIRDRFVKKPTCV